jgi:hypothetical protein
MRDGCLVAVECGARLNHIDQNQACCSRSLVVRPDGSQILDTQLKLEGIVCRAGLAPAQPVQIDKRMGQG